MDILVWLRSLGLGKYEAAFRENEIDETVLPSLTEEHLKQLGVTALGHRVKLLDAIAALRDDAGGKGPSVDAASTSSTTNAHPEDRAERRQVTVMFSDLVGSTALSTRMDPEDLREVISAYQKCVAETVRSCGGFVANYMGDGVLVYFGYPKAHEDDPERAVRAGLELIAAVTALKTLVSLQTRVGIATGLVVIGDLIGSGETQENGIVGETPNLAARLQGIAEPNTLVIAESTRNLVGNLFELEDIGAKDLKGITGSVRAWAALRPASVESRFEALHGSGVTELVGREEELDLLLRRWSKAKTGEGQVVLLSGEAGIGKSRLTAALLEAIAPGPHSRLRHSCSPQRTDSALYPTIRHFERAAGFTLDDTTQTKLDKLDTLLAQSSTSAHDATLFADMLSLPNDGRYPVLELSPQQRRQRTLDALVSQVAALSRQNPLLIIFEDAHWTDPTGLELFSRIIDKIPTLRVLLLITFRPEFEASWVGQPHVTALTINRMTRHEVDAMIERVVASSPLSADIRQNIIERSDGIPLFVEEMTKAALEAEGEREARQTIAPVPSSVPAVPASLHASLMARLDRLGSAKDVAQIGAVIGREFSHAILAAVARLPEAKLQPALERLIASGLVFQQGLPPYATYLFKHALVQDAAYGTLLREPCRALHARIVETLETQFIEIANNQPELLARHCTEAGLIEKAASLWSKAGQRSLEQSALVEAAEKLARALDHLGCLPASPALRREGIKLQVALITPIMQVKGHAAPETMAAAERARSMIEQAEALGEPLEDPLLLFLVLYGIWVTALAEFKTDTMRSLAAQFLTLAQKQATKVPLMVGHRIMGSTLMFTGNLTEGRAHYDQAAALYDPAADRALAKPFGQDVGVATLSCRSTTLWLLGYPDSARRDNKHAIQYAREIGHPASLMLALTYTLMNESLLSGDYGAAHRAVDELTALADDKGALVWKITGTFLRGCLFALTNKGTEAIQEITSSLTAYRSTGAKMFVPIMLVYLSRAYAATRQFDRALCAITEAMTTLETTGERWVEAEVYRVAGELALNSPVSDTAKAEEYFERAITVARRQQARYWELRATMSIARLWRDQGKPQQARELLAPVYGWFTEGFDTRDLKEAKALLGTLVS